MNELSVRGTFLPQPSERPNSPLSNVELRTIPVTLIDLPPMRARRYLGDISGLADSMQTYGQFQPIRVRPTGDRYV